MSKDVILEQAMLDEQKRQLQETIINIRNLHRELHKMLDSIEWNDCSEENFPEHRDHRP